MRHSTAILGLAIAAWIATAPARGDCGACPGDIDSDGSVDTTDLLATFAAWGPCIGCAADLDGNGVVDTVDLLLQLGSWGLCTEPGFCASYTFDAGNASDDTGNGHDGLIVGSPESVPGITGLALRLDGVGDYVVIQSAPQLEADTVILAAWVLLDDPPSGVTTLLEKRTAESGYAVRLDGGGHVSLEVWAPEGSLLVQSTDRVIPGAWASVFAAYDGSSASVWMNGRLSGESAAPALSMANAGPVTIGAAGGGTSSFFGGTIDEVRIGDGSAIEPVVCDEALKIWSADCGRCLDPLFDVTDELNLADLEHRHFGACVVDVNDDGWLDLYYENGLGDPELDEVPPSGVCPELTGTPPHNPESVGTFYLNLGDGTFSKDLAPVAGIDDYWNAMRHVWGDFDNDGRRDLLSHNFIVSPLYRAVSGTNPPIFEDAGLELCLTKGTGASFVDVNHDGFLDIYACEYDPSRLAVDHVNKLLLNDGDGTFTDVTAESGAGLPDNPMGIAFADYDNDGDQDFYVSNSHEAPTRLYRHDGVVDGIPRFTDVAVEAGVAVQGTPGRGFAVAWGDYDNDGRLDLLYVRETGTQLFHNDGPNDQGVWTFSNVTEVGGLQILGTGRWWDGNFADIDNDGWQDLFLANFNETGVAANHLYMNNGDGTWCEVATTLGVDFPDMQQMTFAPGDIDNDGDLDVLLVSHFFGEPNIMLRNGARGNNWLQFRLTGTTSNRDAVGARILVTVDLADGHGPRTLVREVCAGTGFFTDIPRIQTFGLGRATSIDAAVIRWPNGLVQHLGALPTRKRYVITEPPTFDVDIDDDGEVDTADLLLMLASWGPCAGCPADVDGNGVVDVQDLLALFAAWN